MTHNSITINGFNSVDDYNLILIDKDVGTSERTIVSVSIPYSNTPLFFDFSDVLGVPIFNAKSISYTFAIRASTENEMFEKYQAVRNWLLCSQVMELYDSDLEDYFYTARCKSVAKISRISKNTATFTAEFTVNPLMTKTTPTTHTYEVTTSSVVELENQSVNYVCPAVTCTSDFTVSFGGSTYSFATGTSTNDDMMIPTEVTEITLTGTGVITLSYHEEAI